MESESFPNSGVLIALLILVISIVFLIYKRLIKSGKHHILLTGLNDSGKTLLYSQLIHNQHVTTYTSSQENIDEYVVDGKSVTIVDLPGFHSIRQQYFEKYKSSSKGIIYVVDSVTLTKNIRDAANFLFNILVDPVVMKNRPNILVLCNKQDQALAKGSNIIKSALEKEINTLRNTQLNQLQQLDSSTNSEISNKLGDVAKDFSFSNLYCKLDVVESCAYQKNGDVDLKDLKNWIAQVSK